MIVYDVIDNPIYVRNYPSSSSNVVNVLPPGSKIYVIDEEAGWYKTVGGQYVFKTDNIVNKTLRSSNNNLGLGYTPSVNPILPTSPSYNPTASGTTITAEDLKEQKKTPEEKAAEEATKVSEDDKTMYPDVDEVSDKLNKASDSSVGLTCQPTKRVKVGEDGQPIKDEKGNFVLEDAAVSPDAAKKTVIDSYAEGGKYMYVRNIETGELSLVPVEGTKVGNVDSSGNTTYSQFKQYEQEAQQEANETMLDQLKSLGGGIIDAYTSLNDMSVEDTRIIHGMPYQFMPIVDPRTHEKDQEVDATSFRKFGRKFQEKIVAKAPILYMQAGTPVFMRGYSDDAKEGIMNSLLGVFNNTTEELEKLVSDQNSQYYSFSEDSAQYFRAVNTACAFMAHMLQIQHVQLPGYGRENTTDATVGEKIGQIISPRSLGNIDWSFHTPKALGYYRGAVGFYINTESQIQESLSNSTRTSELAGKINQISDQAMEAMFIMGGLSGALDDAGHATLSKMAGFQTSLSQDIVKGEADNSAGLMNSVLRNLTTMVAGGKMIFPDIWANSNFGRSYGVTIKLDSPECDTVSIFLNVLVPLAHILGFVLPRSAGPNTYVSPFLVRCFYKSFFHIDMGIITSCEITKGDAGAWNVDGLPTQITVQLSIKDLYSVLTQAMGVGNNTMISNPAQMEYLSALCGINIAPASFTRSLELWYMANGLGTVREAAVLKGIKMIQGIFKQIQNINTPSRWQN